MYNEKSSNTAYVFFFPLFLYTLRSYQAPTLLSELGVGRQKIKFP